MIELDYENNNFTVEKDGITLTVEPDSHAVNPRDEEYTTELLIWGNDDFKGDENEFLNMQEFEEADTIDIFYKLPIFLDDDTHNISTEISVDNDCRHIGYIFMTELKAEQFYRLTNKDLIKQAKHLCDEKLKDCVREYNDYVNGRIYSYTITDEDGDILDGGNNYYPKETMLDIIEEMAESCLDKYSNLFDMLISEMQIDNNKKPLKKFTNCNVLEVLEEIMKHNTKHYRSDFEYDKADFVNAAYSPKSSEAAFLWLSRPNGTLCTTERNAYVKESYGYNSWIFYGEQTRDPIVAYAVEIKPIDYGYVKGDLYELDYNEHYKRVKEQALPAHHVQLIYRHSEKYLPYEPQYGGKITNEDLLRTQILPADLEKWDKTIAVAQKERYNAQYEEWDIDKLKKHYADIENDGAEMGD